MHFTRLKKSALLMIIVGTVSSAHAQVYPPDAIVEGKTIEEWVGENHNWEWSYIDKGLSEFEAREVHPSQLASVMNDGPVYFTAGYFGEIDEPLDEHFLVPAGRPIVRRLYDFSWDNAPQDLDARGLPAFMTGDTAVAFGQPDTNALLAEISSIIDAPDFKPRHWEVNGVVYTQEQIAAHRVPYEATVSIGQNAFDIPEGDWTQVGDGYWFMLEPLAPGETLSIRQGHINLDGTLSSVIATEYTAIPEPSSLLLTIAGGACATTVVRRRRRKTK